MSNTATPPRAPGERSNRSSSRTASRRTAEGAPRTRSSASTRTGSRSGTSWPRPQGSPRSTARRRRRRRRTVLGGWNPVFLGAVALIVLVLILLIVKLSSGKVSVMLNGEPSYTVEYGSTMEDPGAVGALLNGKGDFKKALDVKESGKVNYEKLGTYTLNYKASHLLSSAKAERTVTVVDTTAPQLTLASVGNAAPADPSQYQEEGYTAVDNYDGDITKKVTYEDKDGVRYYSVSDSSGNTTTAVRLIGGKDPLPPAITLTGGADYTVPAGAAFAEPGFTCMDLGDGDLTDSVVCSGAVNSYAAGIYVLTYTVTDSDGNTTAEQRNVTVTEPAPTADKTVYLTFDDGPGAYTQQLLDVLAKYNVKVTFFVTAEDPNYSDLLTAEAEQGHTVAAHTYSHTYSKIYASESAYFDDLNKILDLIEEKTGTRTNLVRFPGGSSNTVSRKYCSGIMTALTRDFEEKGLEYFDWNVTSGDAGETTDTNEVRQNIISGIQKADHTVVLQHDIKEFSVNAVEDVVVWGLNNGYEFLPITPGCITCHHGVNN